MRGSHAALRRARPDGDALWERLGLALDALVERAGIAA